MVSPDCRITRRSAGAKPLPNLSAAAAANALSVALSVAREALFLLRPGASGLQRADRTYICVPKAGDIDIDLVDHEAGLRSALAISPGPQRDPALSEAVSEEATLLEDEPYADWALEPREALGARDLGRGLFYARHPAAGGVAAGEETRGGASRTPYMCGSKTLGSQRESTQIETSLCQDAFRDFLSTPTRGPSVPLEAG
jgi:hypothetical protein